MFTTAGRIDMDNGLDVTRVDYKSGYCNFGFDTFPTLCHGKPRKRNGTLQANIEYRTPPPKSINVIVYMEFDNNIFVDKTEHIPKDCQKQIAIISDVYFIKVLIQGRYLKE